MERLTKSKAFCAHISKELCSSTGSCDGLNIRVSKKKVRIKYWYNPQLSADHILYFASPA
ncbi:MAG: hypothetical protein K9N05_02930 [Candidatus Marinimicrobia bacterium]|nr:hypothetical protein [Candidatus Neomarinimicrobiota bacterium]